jgi:hypothetical protein
MITLGTAQRRLLTCLVAACCLAAVGQVTIPGLPNLPVDAAFVQYTADELRFVDEHRWDEFLLWLITNNPPDTPVALAPAADTRVTASPLLRASAFADRDGDRQDGSQWQVATSPDFAALVYDTGDWGPIRSWLRLPESFLTVGTRYYWRVRYRDNSGQPLTEWSAWSGTKGAAWSLVYEPPAGEDGSPKDRDGDGVADDVETLLGSDPDNPDSLPAKPGSSPGRAVEAADGLLVDDSPYTIRGVGYQPTPVGETAATPGYRPYRQAQYERDLPLLRAMGCNTLRTTLQVDNADGFLDACWNGGDSPLRVIAGFPVDPAMNFHDTAARNAVLRAFRTYVTALKDHPAVLMWAPGSGVNAALRGDDARLRDWFTLLNALGWVAFEVEGTGYHPVSTDLACDAWNGVAYAQDLAAAHLGVAGLRSDDAHLTGIDLWGLSCQRGRSFASPTTPGSDVFALAAERSSKPIWIAAFGVDAWNHGASREDQTAQAEWNVALWQALAAQPDLCSGAAVVAWSDEWWRNGATGGPASHDPGPSPRGDQPDNWADEEFLGLVGIALPGSPDAVAPRLAYYGLGQAWGTQWPPTCQWGATPEADQWYCGDVVLEALASDPLDPASVACVEYRYSLDSTDGSDGTWERCERGYAESPFTLVWSSRPTEAVDAEVWLRARAVDRDGATSPWALRRIRVDNSLEGVIFQPHPGEAGVPVGTSLTISFAGPVTHPGGAPITASEVASLVALTTGGAPQPFTATLGSGPATVITLRPDVPFRGVTPYTFAFVGDAVDASLRPVPRAGSTFTTAAGPPALLRFSGQPNLARAGGPWAVPVEVAVCDAQGNRVPGNRASVALALDGRGDASPLGGVTVLPAVDGLVQFRGLWISQTGEHRLVATTAGLASALSQPLTVLPGDLDHFGVSAIPDPVDAAMPVSPRVTAYDAFGNVKTDYTGTITFASSDPRAVMPYAYTFYAAELGTHLFGFSVTFYTPGEQWLRASEGRSSDGQLAITVTNAAPAAPRATAPLGGVWTGLAPVLSAAPFADVAGGTHTASQWQVALDPAFDVPTWDSGTAPAGTSALVPTGVLAPGTVYHWRCRYRDDSGDPASAWGGWSAAAAGTTASFRTGYALPFSDDFSSDTGWSGLDAAGRASGTGWERGPAAAGGGLNGNPDPATDHSLSADNHLLGFALGADYPAEMDLAAVTSPAFDCSGQDVVELSFWRWLGVDGNDWAHAAIEISRDGSTWNRLWENGFTAVSDSGWVLATYDITPVAARQPTVFVRFSLGPMLYAFPYCGWNLDDLVVAPAPVLAHARLELGAAQVDVGQNVQVRVFVQEDSAAAHGFRGGPVNLAFDATRLAYSGGFYPSSIIQSPFNTLGRTNGSLLSGLVADLGGATTQDALGDGAPVLYAVLTFRALAAGPAVLALAPASAGLTLAPPVGQIGTWRVNYGSPATLTVVQPPDPPLAKLKLEGPNDVLALGDTCLIKVYVREDSAQANGFLGGPFDLYFDADKVALSGALDPTALAAILQAPFNALGADYLSGSLAGNRVDELGGVTVQAGHGNGAWVLFAIVPFQATAAGSATFAAEPGESSFALTQPVGQLQRSQIDYGAPFNVTITAQPRARLAGLPPNPSRNTSASVTVEGFSVANYRVRQADGSYGPVTPVSQPINLTGLADGPQTLAVIAQSAGGIWQLEAQATQYTWTVDTTPPSTPALSAATPPAGSALSGTAVALTWLALADSLTGVPGVWWTVDRAPTTPAPGTSNGTALPAALTIGSAGQGAYWLHAAAVDGAGNWTPTTHLGPWTYDTVPPTALPGGPYAFTASTALDGSGSSDATSGIAAYLWEFVQNPLGAGTLSNPSSATPTFAARANGTYRVRLTVRDRAGLSHAAEADVVFNRPAPVLHSVVVGDGSGEVTLPEVTLTLALSDGGAAALDYRLAETPGGGSWQPLPAAKQTQHHVDYVLSTGDGVKTLYVTVRDRDYPAFISTEVSTQVTLNRYGWRFLVNVSNANNPALEIGMQATATDGFDSGIDQEPSGGAGLGEANMEQRNRLYRTDVRNTATSADWWVRVRTTATTGVVLTWDPATLPPSGSLNICQWDEFTPGPVPGTLVSMAASASVTVPARIALLLRIHYDFSADAIAPTVTLACTAPEPTNASPIPLTATFSETVSGFAVGDITVSNGVAGGFAGAGASYTFTVTPSGQGTVTVSIGAGVCQDTAGNGNEAATPLTRVYDTVAPVVTGLADDALPTRSKTWTWGGSREVIRFRYLIDANPGGVPAGAYGAATTATQAAGDGLYYLHVQARDDAGNEGAVVTVQALLDNTVPAPPRVIGSTPVHTSAPTWSWTGGGGGNGAFRRQLDGTASAGWTETAATAFTPNAPLSEGLHTLYVQERDAAGNWSGSGSAAIEVDTFCTVTHATGGHGRLAGNPVQTVPYNGGTTPVQAVPDYLYLFDRWDDSSAQNRDNPRVLSGITTDLALTAQFRPATAVLPPTGPFLAMVDAAAPTRRRLWDLTGDYATTVKGNPLTMALVHDATGRLSGTATYTVAADTVVTMPVRGSVKGAGGSICMKGTLRGADPARTTSIALTLNLAVDIAARRLSGRLSGSIGTDGSTAAVDAPVTLVIPGAMDGTWALAFQLTQSGPAVTGTARLTLANGMACAFRVEGRKGANGTAVLSLAGDQSDPAARTFRVRTTITPLEGGWARLESFSAQGYGQALTW